MDIHTTNNKSEMDSKRSNSRLISIDNTSNKKGKHHEQDELTVHPVYQWIPPRRVISDFRDWAGLPDDVFINIFVKAETIPVICSAQFVCRKWHEVSKKPQIFQQVIIDTLYLDFDIQYSHKFVEIVKTVIDRSDGCLEEISIDGHVNFIQEHLKLISERSPCLKRLSINSVVEEFETELIEACRKFPLLEKLSLIGCFKFTDKGMQSIGQFTNLKEFAVGGFFLMERSQSNKVAYQIANNLHGLRKLEIYNSTLDRNGLMAILDGCPDLQNIYLRDFKFLKFEDDLKARLALDKVKVKCFDYWKVKTVDVNDPNADYDCEDFYNYCLHDD
ncbi:hypothetical protein ZOSMA_49G01040 [Zostera marina]|uniref:F-box domain-containing protein n=1 Tax=Zostera marina TaxID=29655 RepID=A0A0K9P1F1_ZOSMR|nr:hypothetical protein ZOSMA_49G01040 [Zostera marina]